MTKLPSRRLLLSAAFASTLVVTGCDVSTSSDKTPASAIAYNGVCGVVDAATQSQCLVIPGLPTTVTGLPPVFIPGTYPRFNPAISDVPLNTDFPFAGTTDGTAYVNATGTVPDAINRLDGWSTNAYFDVAFSGSIDPTTINDGTNPPTSPFQNVFLLPIETVANGDPLNPADIATPAFDTSNVAATKFTASVVSLDGGSNNVLRITPTSPLFAKKKFLVVITNGIMDTAVTPAAITKSAVYDLIGSTVPLIDPQLQPVRDAVQGWEQLAVGFLQIRNGQLNTLYSLGLPTDSTTLEQSLALTFTFTTTDPVTPLVAMAAPRAALVAAGATALQAGGLDSAGALSTPKSRALGISPATATDLNTLSGGALASGVANLYTGYLTLPYYQAAPTSTTDFTYLGKMWDPDLALATLLGKPVPQDIGGSYNVTYRYPFAAATGTFNGSTGSTTETIPLQVTLPSKTFASPALGTTCGNVEAAQSGYPVVIYVHGITSDRTSVIGLAHALAQACIATVAIDLPMHGIDSNSPYASSLNVNHGSISAAIGALYGSPVAASLRERHFDETLNSGTGQPAAMNFSTPNAYDLSGSLFVNLNNLMNTRDNLKESVQDLLNLNASLGTIAALDLDGDTHPDFNLSKVYVIGHSLGGMISTTFVTVNQLAMAQDVGAGFTPNLNPIQGLLSSAGGTELPQILLDSPEFGPPVSAGLTAAGAGAGTSNRESFLYVTQSMVDSADPVNFAAVLHTLQVPTLVQMMVGGGDTTALGDSTTWVTDQVVSNSIAGAPLAGTAPLATLLGAGPTADGSTNNATGGNNLLAKLTIGYHQSLLIPNPYTAAASWTNGEKLATSELQTEAVSFVLTGGAAFSVGTAGSGAAANYTVP